MDSVVQKTFIENLITETQQKAIATLAVDKIREIAECSNPLKCRSLAKNAISDINQKSDEICQETLKQFFEGIEKNSSEFDPIFLKTLNNLKEQYLKDKRV